MEADVSKERHFIRTKRPERHYVVKDGKLDVKPKNTHIIVVLIDLMSHVQICDERDYKNALPKGNMR